MEKTFKAIDFNEEKLKYINNSNILIDIPKTMNTEVKCFYKSKHVELIVMNDQRVYVTISNESGKLGVCEKSCSLTEIPELSGI